jgi:signal transduction histidine kinase
MSTTPDPRAELVTAILEDRRRLEHELHQGAQQQLVALRVKLGLALDAASGDSDLAARLADLDERLVAALDQLRDLAQEIYPAVLADHGLKAALQSAARRSEHAVALEVGVGRCSPEVEYAVYRCCREAALGAEGPTVVRVAEEGGQIRFAVEPAGEVEDGTAALVAGLGGQLTPGVALSGTVPVDIAATRKAGESASLGATSGAEA